ncbi:hypothetical protein F4677DRAFT_449145 [Hypoxylon crocopeplum]|nr:hypothetical protein F4677DRAFT_449145 [Hypoxylon crocopeplum]
MAGYEHTAEFNLVSLRPIRLLAKLSLRDILKETECGYEPAVHRYNTTTMAEYAAAAITAATATAAIVGSSAANRHQELMYRAYASDENSPSWIQQQRQRQRPLFAGTRPRHTYGYYGQPLYYPSGLHEHYVHHAECPGSQCHYRAFLTDSIQQYNESRRQLRQTYVANVRDLSGVHERQPSKAARDKDGELARLYAYYVSRVRDVFEDHRRDHRRLFGQDYLCWAPPEREDRPIPPSRAASRSRRRRGRTGSRMDGTESDVDFDDAQGATTSKEGREGGSDCEAEGDGSGSSGQGLLVGDVESGLTA